MSNSKVHFKKYCEEFTSKYPEKNIVKITEKHKGSFTGFLEGQFVRCHLSGKLEFSTRSNFDLPAIGDWCVCSPPYNEGHEMESVILQEIVPRKTYIGRGAAGATTQIQVLASNVDHAFIVSSMNSEFNLGRIQRYLIVAKAGGVQPVFVLSKADETDCPETYIKKLKDAHPGYPIIALSNVDQRGVQDVQSILKPGETGVFLGSSGVGKSSLVNSLLGENLQTVHEIREKDSKGRHTTTGGKTFVLDNHAIVIDTPGLRELAIAGDPSILESEFEHIVELIYQCKYRNCTHQTEDGCAIRAAIENEFINEAEFRRYEKMKRELRSQAVRSDQRLAAEEKKKWKDFSREIKKVKKLKKGARNIN